jgi:hypothetical protein
VADDPCDRSRSYVAAGVLFFDDTGRVLLVSAAADLLPAIREAGGIDTTLREGPAGRW